MLINHIKFLYKLIHYSNKISLSFDKNNYILMCNPVERYEFTKMLFSVRLIYIAT